MSALKIYVFTVVLVSEMNAAKISCYCENESLPSSSSESEEQNPLATTTEQYVLGIFNPLCDIESYSIGLEGPLYNMN